MGKIQLSNQTCHGLIMPTTLNKTEVSMLNVLEPHSNNKDVDNTMAFFWNGNDKDRLGGSMAAVLKCVACMDFAVDYVLGTLV